MEVTVLEATNPPGKPVLAVHAGSVRRQAKLEVNTPFVIPHPGSTSCSVEVSLFQQLASQTLPDDDREEACCSIPVRKPDGAASQVKLSIRRGPGCPASSDAKKISPQDDLGMTRDYLDHHQLQHRIQSLIQDVLREQPEEPYKYMIETLKKFQQEKRKASQAALIPKPPAGKKPSDSSAPPHGGRSYKTATLERPACTDEVGRIAFATLGLVLRSPAVLKVAEESLRADECERAASRMWASVRKRSCESVVEEAVNGSPVRLQARTVLKTIFSAAAARQTSEYHRSLAFLVCNMAFRGAVRVLGQRDDWEESFIDISTLPKDMVSLDANVHWSAWLGR